MATISEGFGESMIDPRVYSQRYARIMWKRNPVMMAEKAHCYPCCDVPTNLRCTGCGYPYPCRLRRECGRSSLAKMMVVGGRDRRKENLYISGLCGMLGAAMVDMPFVLMNHRDIKHPRVMGSSIFRMNTKPTKACLLPGCHNTTTHNGGYCCADHCREHRGK